MRGTGNPKPFRLRARGAGSAQRDYVTIGEMRQPQTASAFAEPSNAHDFAETAYTLESMAMELRERAARANASEPTVLIIAYGVDAKRIVAAVKATGLRTCLGVPAGSRRDAAAKAADAVVAIGDRDDESALLNAHDALVAIDETHADVVLTCGAAETLGESGLFVARAAKRGARVFRPVSSGAVSLGWIVCAAPDAPMPEERWQTCRACGRAFDETEFQAAGCRCPSCGSYARMTAAQRLASVLDEGSFEAWDEPAAETDPLAFPGYLEKLVKIRERTDVDEGVCTGAGRIAGLPVAVGVMDSTFMMGSMGSVVGERLARLFERATEERLAVVVFTASGGARMQEGIVSLMQMAKVSAAVARHSEAGLLYVSVLTDPTTGGVTASFALQGDIVLAEPGALIGFAGQRVIRDTIRQELPEGFQTAEFMLAHGLIDDVVARGELRSRLANLIGLHHRNGRDHVPAPGRRDVVVDYASIMSSLAQQRASYNAVTYAAPDNLVVPSVSKREIKAAMRAAKRTLRRTLQAAIDLDEGQDDCAFEGCAPRADRPVGKRLAPRSGAASERPAWECVLAARDTHRPTGASYIAAIVDGFVELHGDRCYADDAAIVAGIGWLGGTPVTVIAQEKGCDVKERVRRNFGCAQPEGYRKALRLMRQAEKFNRPVVCIVDTQGALCGIGAEERGQGGAIADNLLTMARLRVPIVSVLVGEGGSGGALALAVSDRVAMQRNAVYSVLSPEGFASILWKDAKRAPEAAEVMKMTAADCLHLGVVDAVLDEGESAAVDPEAARQAVAAYVRAALSELTSLPIDELLARRYARFRVF